MDIIEQRLGVPPHIAGPAATFAFFAFFLIKKMGLFTNTNHFPVEGKVFPPPFPSLSHPSLINSPS